MQTPQNDYILLSLVNTFLRDKYSTLAALCEEEDWDEVQLRGRLGALGYVYDEDENAFKRS